MQAMLIRYLYFCLCFLLNKTQVLISAMIVATCKTTRTAITASSEVELPFLLVVSRGIEYFSVYMHGFKCLRLRHADKTILPSKLVGNFVVTCILVGIVDIEQFIEQSLYNIISS